MLRSGLKSSAKSFAGVEQPSTVPWESNYCDLCCAEFSRAFSLSCSHTFCDHCIVALSEENKVSRDGSIECPICLVSSTHLIMKQPSPDARSTETAYIPCQSSIHKSIESSCAEYFCIRTGELLCATCTASPSYSGKAILPAAEAAEHRASFIRDISNRIRVVVGKVRRRVTRLRQLQTNTAEKLKAALDELQAQKATLVASINERFASLEQELVRMTKKRIRNVDREVEDITQHVGAVMETISSCEKHASQQHPLVFLAEAETLDGRLAASLGSIQGRLQTLQEPLPESVPLPKLSGMAGALAAVRCLGLSERR